MVEKIWILMIFTAVLGASQMYLLEQSSLQKFPGRDFQVLAALIRENLGHTFSYSEGLKGLDLTEVDVKSIHDIQEEASKMEIEEKAIKYTFDKTAFVLDLKYSYSLRILRMIPMSGEVIVRIIAEKASYVLKIETKSIDPALTITFGAKGFNNTNSWAETFGLNSILESALKEKVKPYYTNLFQQLTSTKLKEFYHDNFQDFNIRLNYPSLHNANVTVKNKLLEFTLTKESLGVKLL